MRFELRAALVATSALAAIACGEKTSVVQPEAVASMSVTPAYPTIVVTTQVQLTATVRDASHRILTDRAVMWGSADTAVATVSATGLVTGRAPGPAQVTATSETKSASATVTVIPIPVAAVTVAPADDTLVVGQTVLLTAMATDSVGHVLTGRPVSWSSGSPAVAAVSAGGMALAVGTGFALITVLVDGSPGLGRIWVPAAFAAVSPGPRHSCGVRTDGAALCWGDNSTGQLGKGSIGFGGAQPVVVQGSLTFSQLATGADLTHSAGFTCGEASRRTASHAAIWTPLSCDNSSTRF
jgi:hypothetical protein